MLRHLHYAMCILALQASRIETWYGYRPLKDGTGTGASSRCSSCAGQEDNAICSCVPLLWCHRYDCTSRLCSVRHQSRVHNFCPGSADLFEEASAVLKSSEDVKQTAESLRIVLALSSSYNKVQAWLAMAAHEAAQSNMGIACADLQV